MISFGKRKFGFDDARDAFVCHGTGGIWGGILTGVFAISPLAGEGHGGLIEGNLSQFGAQITGVVISIAVAVIGTLVCYLITRILTGKLRVSDKDELLGLDITQHGESAYPSFNGLE